MCSDKVVCRGYTLLVDTHAGYYKELKTVVRCIHTTIQNSGYQLSYVIIIKKENNTLSKSRLQASFRREKYGIGVEVGHVTYITYKYMYIVKTIAYSWAAVEL